MYEYVHWELYLDGFAFVDTTCFIIWTGYSVLGSEELLMELIIDE